ncbi:6-phospho-3-hexuloisomerase [Aerococcus tenax]|uniref:6-phospho-3-hexuloisomerase n=1 Tax=Aerococcus tenax TaxID=3078812 RepID=UPI0018A7D925|nr:6-phospho-3-hexuloisomerase [Aerococcus tenax]
MNTKQIAVQAANEISEVLSKVNSEEINELINQIKSANNIFVCGAGRSLLMLRGLAMRLMHIGLKSHVVGDTVTPAFNEGDLLIVASGSGETENLISIAKRAKNFGGQVALLSIFPNSSIGTIADLVVKIPAYTDKLPESDENVKGILPGGSMFEESVLILSDSLIITLADDVSLDQPFENHANLE